MPDTPNAVLACFGTAQDCLDVRRCCANRLFMAHWLRHREILEVETTMMTTIKLPRLLSIPSLLLLAMLATVLAGGACGSDGELSAAQSPSDTAPGQRAQLTGTIEIDGSSTVAPITEAVAEEFRKVQSGVQVNVGISGSGGGFKRFTVGETDISDASRTIKSSEAATASENGIEYFEFLVGVDGLSVMVSPKNDFVECMTIDQLKMLWEPRKLRRLLERPRLVMAGQEDQPLRTGYRLRHLRLLHRGGGGRGETVAAGLHRV